MRINYAYPSVYFRLTNKEIDKNIVNQAGVFLLGDLNGETRKFFPRYIGRSGPENDLNSTLKQFLNSPYQWFSCAYTRDEIESYLVECEYMHDLVTRGYQLENTHHPGKPESRRSPLYCPICRK